MRRFPVAAKTLRDYRAAFISIAFVLFAIALLDLLIYPSYKDSLEDFELPAGFEGFIGESPLSSPEGFIAAEFFAWIPLLLIVVAVIAGTGIIAGEEAAGTMDLLLAQPVSRRRLLLERFGGAALGLLAAALAGLPGFALGMLLVDFDLGFGRIIAATVNMVPVTLLFLAFSIWMSSALANRTQASIVSIGLVVAAYFLNLIGASADVLEWPRKLSPFYWADGSRVLVDGFDYARAGGLLAVAALFVLLALRSFEQRDIASSAGEWRLSSLLLRFVRRTREEAHTEPPAHPAEY
ncbi:MAG: ABC transporter permease [Dehalococcoidia bacterium]|nr:ABC transporter permease [Dehalococcoidia bacterium]